MVLCNNYVSAEDGNGNALPMLVRFYAYYQRDSSWVKLGLLSIQPGIPTKIALTQGIRHLFVPIVEEGYEIPAEVEMVACSEDVVFIYKKFVPLPPPEMCNVQIRPVGQDNMRVDATIKMVVFDTGRTETKRTYDALGVYFDIEQGYSYKITATSDKCETFSQSFMVPRQTSYWEIVHMDCEIKPHLAVVNCYTKRTDGVKESGIDVTVVVVGGKTETNQTNSDGIVSFGLLHGDEYTITLTPPEGCNCDCWDCLCVVSDIADKDRTRDYPLRYELVEEPDPEGWHIKGPITVEAGIEFDITMTGAPTSNDAEDWIEIKVDKDWAIDPVIGKGTSDSRGEAIISCIIPEPGTFDIYGYYPGSFIPGGEKSTNTLSITATGEDGKVLTVVAPSFAMAGIIEISGKGIAGDTVYIMGEKGWIGFDLLAKDTELTNTVVNSEGKYTTEIELDEFGSVVVYAKHKRGITLDNPLGTDIYSTKHTIWIFTSTVVIAMLLVIGLIMEKKYNKLGLFRR